MRRRVTLKDVAEASGSAISTVSSILNNRPDSWASAETRRRVIDAAARLGFRPNRMARSLRGKNYDLVLASVPHTTNPCFAELAGGIRHHLAMAGFDLTVEETGFLQEKDEHLISTLPVRYIDGALLVTSTGMESSGHFPRAAGAMPLVLLGPGLPDTPCDRVQVDIDDGLRQALIHLQVLGHRGVGIVDSMSEYLDPTERFEHMNRILEDLGMHTRPEWHIRSTDALDHVRERVRAWAAGNRRRKSPGALVCTNDLTAIACIRGLAEAELRVPEDFSVVGFDGIQLGEMLTRRLTTVSQPLMDMSARAVQLLLGRINGTLNTPPAAVILPSKLRIGETTGPLPASSKVVLSRAEIIGSSAKNVFSPMKSEDSQG